MVDSDKRIHWDQVVDIVEYSLNNTIHTTIKQYPSVMLFGVQQRGKVHDFLKETLEKFDENSEMRNLGGYKKRSS